MGYVFDAMNRSERDRDDDSQSSRPIPFSSALDSASPPPKPPIDDAFDRADDAYRPAVEAPSPRQPEAPAPAYAAPSITELANRMAPTQADEDFAQPESFPINQNYAQPGRYDDRLIVLEKPGGVIAEEYRAIRTGILARWQQKRHLIHTITSATPQEGKTITSLNLGLSFAELRNRRTVVVEADLRLPQFRKLLALENKPGLVDALRGEFEISKVVQQVMGTDLHVIPAGKRASNDTVQLLSCANMSRLLKMLRRQYDHVIVDTPPVVELADAGILGAQSDDVLMIVRMERTPRSLVEQAVRTLESYNAPVAGMIATDHQRHQGRYYYYRYGYRYGYRYRYYTDEHKAAA